jgi:hypothetical protein
LSWRGSAGTTRKVSTSHRESTVYFAQSVEKSYVVSAFVLRGPRLKNCWSPWPPGPWSSCLAASPSCFRRHPGWPTKVTIHTLRFRLRVTRGLVAKPVGQLNASRLLAMELSPSRWFVVTPAWHAKATRVGVGVYRPPRAHWLSFTSDQAGLHLHGRELLQACLKMRAVIPANTDRGFPR